MRKYRILASVDCRHDELNEQKFTSNQQYSNLVDCHKLVCCELRAIFPRPVPHAGYPASPNMVFKMLSAAGDPLKRLCTKISDTQFGFYCTKDGMGRYLKKFLG